MRILAADTTSRRGSVAIAQNSDVIAKAGIFSERGHAVRLLSSIDFLLNSIGVELEGIDAFAVASGPGSFTGIRIGLATIKGLAETLNKKVIPLVGLEALAYKAKHLEGLICPMIDAERNQIYATLFRSDRGQLTQTSENHLTEAAEWIQSLPRKRIYFLGDGAYRCSDIIYREKLEDWQIVETDLFLADAIAQLAFDKLSRGFETRLEELDGYYLRPANVDLKKRP